MNGDVEDFAEESRVRDLEEKKIRLILIYIYIRVKKCVKTQPCVTHDYLHYPDGKSEWRILFLLRVTPI